VKVIWTLRAQTDLREIADYVSEFDARAALALVRRLRAAATNLREHPQMGRAGRVEETRELVVPGTTYILPYRVRDGRVEILAALHASRQWPDRL
jgi:toxin ParE1/3/4